MVTPAVCPRLFGLLTMLTFGALDRNHTVSTALRPSPKKNTHTHRQGRLVVHVRSAIYHELSRKQPKLEGKCVSVGVNALAVVR